MQYMKRMCKYFDLSFSRVPLVPLRGKPYMDSWLFKWLVSEPVTFMVVARLGNHGTPVILTNLVLEIPSRCLCSPHYLSSMSMQMHIEISSESWSTITVFLRWRNVFTSASDHRDTSFLGSTGSFEECFLSQNLTSSSLRIYLVCGHGLSFSLAMLGGTCPFLDKSLC